jgi:hypothetical protein
MACREGPQGDGFGGVEAPIRLNGARVADHHGARLASPGEQVRREAWVMSMMSPI